MASAHDREELLIASDVSNKAVAAGEMGRDPTEEVSSRQSGVVWLASFLTFMIINSGIFQDSVLKSGLKPTHFVAAGCSEISCSSFPAPFWTSELGHRQLRGSPCPDPLLSVDNKEIVTPVLDFPRRIALWVYPH